MAAPKEHRYRCPVEDMTFNQFTAFQKHVEEMHPPAPSETPPKKVPATKRRQYGEPYSADEVARLFQHWDRDRPGRIQAEELAKAGLFPGRSWQSIHSAAYRWILKPTVLTEPPRPSTEELSEKSWEQARAQEPSTPREPSPEPSPTSRHAAVSLGIMSRLESIMAVMQVPEESRKFVLTYARETPTAQNPWSLYNLLSKVHGIRSTTAQLITNYVFGSEAIPESGSALIHEPLPPVTPAAAPLPPGTKNEDKAIQEAITQITTAVRIRAISDAVAKVLSQSPQRGFFGPEEAKVLGTEMGKAAGLSFKDVLEDVRTTLARIEANIVPREPRTKRGPSLQWSPEEIQRLREVADLTKPDKKAEAKRLAPQFPGRSWEAILKAIQRYVAPPAKPRPPREPWSTEEVGRLVTEWNRKVPAWDEARRLAATGRFPRRTAKAIYEMAFKLGLPTGAFEAQERMEDADAQLRREREIDRELKKKD